MRDDHDTGAGVLDFIHGFRLEDAPEAVSRQVGLCLLDLIGVGIGGAGTKLSAIIRDHAAASFRGSLPMLFDGRPVSAPGLALAGGMTIDALDGHDGYNPAKGHVGCGLFPATLAQAMAAGTNDGRAFAATIAMGYEMGARLGAALHATSPDYHTSGAWVAVAAAATGARLMGLDAAATRHALGIAEYHGPRSQMMRDIDSPTMVKDGSGWGAMAGVSAVELARAGFTGAPALTVESAQVRDCWRDLGTRWLILEQYFKPYPVCRWAHAPVEAVLELRAAHALRARDVAKIEVESFHEATRLATLNPANTEEAQYSTAFPCAVAMARGAVAAADVSGAALNDPEIRRLAASLTMSESDAANAAFPTTRLARVRLHLRDGRVLESGWTRPRWDADAPPTPDELHTKFHALADPTIGTAAAARIETAVADTVAGGALSALTHEICRPVG